MVEDTSFKNYKWALGDVGDVNIRVGDLKVDTTLGAPGPTMPQILVFRGLDECDRLGEPVTRWSPRHATLRFDSTCGLVEVTWDSQGAPDVTQTNDVNNGSHNRSVVKIGRAHV